MKLPSIEPVLTVYRLTDEEQGCRLVFELSEQELARIRPEDDPDRIRAIAAADAAGMLKAWADGVLKGSGTDGT